MNKQLHSPGSSRDADGDLLEEDTALLADKETGGASSLHYRGRRSTASEGVGLDRRESGMGVPGIT